MRVRATTDGRHVGQRRADPPRSAGRVDAVHQRGHDGQVGTPADGDLDRAADRTVAGLELGAVGAGDPVCRRRASVDGRERGEVGGGGQSGPLDRQRRDRQQQHDRADQHHDQHRQHAGQPRLALPALGASGSRGVLGLRID